MDKILTDIITVMGLVLVGCIIGAVVFGRIIKGILAAQPAPVINNKAEAHAGGGGGSGAGVTVPQTLLLFGVVALLIWAMTGFKTGAVETAPQAVPQAVPVSRPIEQPVAVPETAPVVQPTTAPIEHPIVIAPQPDRAVNPWHIVIAIGLGSIGVMLAVLVWLKRRESIAVIVPPPMKRAPDTNPRVPYIPIWQRGDYQSGSVRPAMSEPQADRFEEILPDKVHEVA